MYCPVCKEKELVMSERQNIEIDYCPSCRGVWLDRGELDKIIDQSLQELTPVNAPPERSGRHQLDHRMAHHDRESSSDGYRHRPKKKESFWQELFD
ncbi:TFIIB-type zinc ribbon-containing protein [Glaciimonas immobilis]|uniref:Transcription factor zinc-finger domain-containing protein n=1 Tax=Glaciimonas immobilis TaxID=728004 RepID=A0A840RTT5_9BURK|nr:zf-TFIIB domain-containing protein [Glaciimonas immobilis]KAF3997101.1 hypothetical protein HAV38_15670 [Glaciimonas immobilis]MBB5199960.1 hypothetical protein [Glaciimonas immobilis]